MSYRVPNATLQEHHKYSFATVQTLLSYILYQMIQPKRKSNLMIFTKDGKAYQDHLI